MKTINILMTCLGIWMLFMLVLYYDQFSYDYAAFGTLIVGVIGIEVRNATAIGRQTGSLEATILRINSIDKKIEDMQNSFMNRRY